MAYRSSQERFQELEDSYKVLLRIFLVSIFNIFLLPPLLRLIFSIELNAIQGAGANRRTAAGALEFLFVAEVVSRSCGISSPDRAFKSPWLPFGSSSGLFGGLTLLTCILQCFSDRDQNGSEPQFGASLRKNAKTKQSFCHKQNLGILSGYDLMNVGPLRGP